VGAVRVEFYDSGVLLGQSAAPYSIAWDTAAAASGPHTLLAYAYDAAGNVGVSPAVSVIVENQLDTTAPSAATGLRATNLGQTSIALAWDAATDNVAVTGYRLYELVRMRYVRRWVLRQDRIAGTVTTVAGLVPNSRHVFAVVAFDAAGNLSAKSAPLIVTTLP
jgi:hypothetical protein